MKTRETTSVNTNETTQTEDTNKSERAKDILCGVPIALGTWGAGVLLAGKLSFLMFLGEFPLYETGPLVCLFPFLFAAVCVGVTLGAKRTSPVFVKTALIALALPLIVHLVGTVVTLVSVSVGMAFNLDATTPYKILTYPLILLGAPCTSVFVEFAELGQIAPVRAAFTAGMCAGPLTAAVIYRRNRTEKGNERNGS